MLLSDTAAQDILDAFFAAEGTLYVALNSVIPDTDGTGGTEITGTGYARQATDLSADWTRTGQIFTNDNDIDFGTAGSNWAPVGSEAVAFTFWDASSSGNLRMLKALVAPRIINSGDPVKFPAGSIQITAA